MGEIFPWPLREFVQCHFKKSGCTTRSFWACRIQRQSVQEAPVASIFFGSARGSRRYKEKRYDDTAGLRSESPGPEDSSVSAQRCWKAWSHPLSPLIFSPHQESRKMKIAVLTSGGDSAGMNAVVRGVVRAGIVKFAASCPILRSPHPCLSIRPFLCPPSQRMRDLGRSRRVRRSRPWK